MKRKYRWGILGAGRIADKFCTALNFVEDAEIYAIASRDINSAKSYAEKYHAVQFYTNYIDLIQDQHIDIIYIATPHAFHYEQALLCLQHNKPVLCEKPLTLSYAQTSSLISAAKVQGVFFMEGMWTSCMPFLDKIQTIIKDDVIGIPQYLSADFGFFNSFDPGSRLFDKALGGGSLMDVGVYPLFLATCILGEPSVIKTVSKLTATAVDEYVNVVLQYEGGATAHLISSIGFNTAIAASIVGTKGSVHIKNPWFKATEFSVHLVDGQVKDYSFPHLSNGFDYEIKEVMHCLDNGLLESVKMPHQLTLLMSKIAADILKQAGVVYM